MQFCRVARVARCGTIIQINPNKMVSGPVLAHLHGVKKSFWKNIEVWPTITRADGAATCQVSESTQAMSEFCIHLDTGSKYQGLPSGYVKIAKMAIEIVDFPMKNGGSFHSFLYVYQRVSRATSECQRKKLFNAMKKSGSRGRSVRNSRKRIST